MTRLHLVRHGRPLTDRAVPAPQWDLDPAAYDDVWALRARLPARAAWYCSPEPKARQTAQLLTDGEVGVLDGLAEHHRDGGWVDDFEAAVRAAFTAPEVAAREGWESLGDCRRRVVAAVEPVLEAHDDEEVVLVGHGTAWTVLRAALTGSAPDVEWWATLRMPDVVVIETRS